MHDQSLLEDAIDIPVWLEADRDTPLASRTERDRGIARHISARDGVERARAWWRHMRTGDAAGARIVRDRRLVKALLIVVGLVAGSALAAAALHYDGAYPVNVVSAWVLLVGLQSIFLLLTLLLLPGGRIRIRLVQDAIGALNPAVIATAVYRRVAKLPEQTQALLRWHSGRAAVHRFARWQLLSLAQYAAVAFNAGALVTAFALLTFTDLAFGWSTTLGIEAATIQRLTDLASRPWGWLAPAAVPDATLIEGSRYYRLAQSDPALQRPEAFTDWWPFLLLSIVVYGLLPRILLLAFCAVRLRAATCALLREDPQVTALLDRMEAPAVRLGADTPEAARATDGAMAPRLEGTPGGAVTAIVWAGAIPPESVADTVRRHLGSTLDGPPLVAGGGTSLTGDRRTLELLREAAPRRVAVLTRGYEPPVLDLADFLSSVRAAIGSGASIVVVPLPEPDTMLAPRDLEVWRRSMATMGDDRLYVEAFG